MCKRRLKTSAITTNLKHTRILKANIDFLDNYLRLCCNMNQRSNSLSWLIQNHCCKQVIKQLILHTLCPLHVHLHHAEAEAGLSELCCSRLQGVKEWTAKQKKMKNGSHINLKSCTSCHWNTHSFSHTLSQDMLHYPSVISQINKYTAHAGPSCGQTKKICLKVGENTGTP